MRVCQGRLSRGTYRRTHPTRPSICRASTWVLSVTAALGPVTARDPSVAAGQATDGGPPMTCGPLIARGLATAVARPTTCVPTMGRGQARGAVRDEGANGHAAPSPLACSSRRAIQGELTATPSAIAWITDRHRPTLPLAAGRCLTSAVTRMPCQGAANHRGCLARAGRAIRCRRAIRRHCHPRH
jgi:hypothetical protein